jgi:hypothetical protein
VNPKPTKNVRLIRQNVLEIIDGNKSKMAALAAMILDEQQLLHLPANKPTIARNAA